MSTPSARGWCQLQVIMISSFTNRRRPRRRSSFRCISICWCTFTSSRNSEQPAFLAPSLATKGPGGKHSLRGGKRIVKRAGLDLMTAPGKVRPKLLQADFSLLAPPFQFSPRQRRRCGRNPDEIDWAFLKSDEPPLHTHGYPAVEKGHRFRGSG